MNSDGDEGYLMGDRPAYVTVVRDYGVWSPHARGSVGVGTEKVM